MRVLIDYRSALKDPSGAGEYCRGLVAGLVEHQLSGAERIDLTVFSSSWKDRLGPLHLGAGVKVVDRHIPVSVLNLAWHRLQWPAAEWVAGSPFDVVHSMHPLLLPARRAAQIVTIHDVNFLTYPERTRAEIRRDYPALARPHAQRADAVVVPSHFTARSVEQELGVAPERIFVCPPGAPEWSARQAVSGNGYVLFIGTLEPRKNLGMLLDAYEQLIARTSAPPMVIAGQARRETRQWLDRIRRPPLASVVQYVGYVQPGKRRALFEGARVLVQPSFDEGFGLPVLEAMTIGVPVVASNRGALPEVLGGAGLTVDAEDSAGMAAAIERLLVDEGLRAACASKGLIRAGQFRWAVTAARVMEAYRQAIDHHQRRSRSFRNR